MNVCAEPIERVGGDGARVDGLRLGCVEVYLGNKNGKFPDGNQVVVRGSDSMAVFDTPLVSHRIPEIIADADVVILGHVHEDHTAGLYRMPDIPVHAPRADVQALRSFEGLALHYGYRRGVVEAMVARARDDFHFRPRPDALPYDDGAVWDLGGVRVRAVHMPGHTGGHSVLLVEPLGIAFVGDIDLTGFGPYYGDACSDLRSLRRTLGSVGSLPATAWITSHHKGVITDRQQFDELLLRFAQVVERREQSILDVLSAAPSSIDALMARRFVYPATFDDLYVPDVERRTIGQHLDSLLERGQAKAQGDLYVAT